MGEENNEGTVAGVGSHETKETLVRRLPFYCAICQCETQAVLDPSSNQYVCRKCLNPLYFATSTK
jgi:predicted SprT family Zn-dependent metalloprotease